MKVVGVDRLLARFAKAAVTSAVAERVTVSTTADVVAELARGHAPVDTGTLRDSIKAEPDRVEAQAPYAGFVEFGTTNSPAQPYMRPAADEAGQHDAPVQAGSRILGTI